MAHPQKSGSRLHGILALLMLTTSTIVFTVPVLIMGILKLIPVLRWKIACARVIDTLATWWCDVNNAYIRWTSPIQWRITGLTALNPKNSYLLIANHQSWLDIVVLQRLFNRQIPMLKFFAKAQLKWIPLLGFCWWALGYPFMKRYSPAYLEKNPHKKGHDLQTTQKAIRLFKHIPSTVMSFVEGTRFTPEKKHLQQSPYAHLLKPKAGGLSYVISAMGNQVDCLLDVTLVYPDTTSHSLWDFLCHRIHTITAHVRQIPIPVLFQNEKVLTDPATKAAFHTWLNEQWQEKDRWIASQVG